MSKSRCLARYADRRLNSPHHHIWGHRIVEIGAILEALSVPQLVMQPPRLCRPIQGRESDLRLPAPPPTARPSPPEVDPLIAPTAQRGVRTRLVGDPVVIAVNTRT